MVLTVTNTEPVGSAVSATLNVTIGGRLCTALAYDSQGRILCTPPIGEGATNAFTVSLYGMTSPTFALNYAYFSPTITAVSVSNGPTAGNTTIQITGFNFGLSPNVTIGAKVCALQSVSGPSVSPASITCVTPAYEGVQLISVVAGGQSSFPATPYYFTYDVPVLHTFQSSQLNTQGVTNTANALLIWGTNFGSSTAAVSVTVGGVTATVSSWNQTFIVCSSVPAGSGTTNQIVVTVSGRSSTTALFFRYAAPTLISISPNPVPLATTRLTLSGTNFGPAAIMPFNSVHPIHSLPASL